MSLCTELPHPLPTSGFHCAARPSLSGDSSALTPPIGANNDTNQRTNVYSHDASHERANQCTWPVLLRRVGLFPRSFFRFLTPSRFFLDTDVYSDKRADDGANSATYSRAIAGTDPR